jgi:hypothetical protein
VQLKAHLHLRGDWTLFVGNKGVILGVAFPKLGPQQTALSKEYVPIPLEVVNILPNLGLSRGVHLLIVGQEELDCAVSNGLNLEEGREGFSMSFGLFVDGLLQLAADIGLSVFVGTTTDIGMVPDP